MVNIGLFNIPTNCDFSSFYTEQQNEVLSLIIVIIIITISLIYIKNNKGAF